MHTCIFPQFTCVHNRPGGARSHIQQHLQLCGDILQRLMDAVTSGSSSVDSSSSRFDNSRGEVLKDLRRGTGSAVLPNSRCSSLPQRPAVHCPCLSPSRGRSKSMKYRQVLLLQVLWQLVLVPSGRVRWITNLLQPETLAAPKFATT